MRFPVLLSLVGLPVIATAQQQQPTLTVDDAVASAVKNNPRLAAVVRDTRAASHGVASARAPVNPEIVVTPGTSAGSDEEMLISQRLEINGTRSARTGVASARLRSARATALVELRDVVLETKTAYFELVRARNQQALAADLFKSTEEFDRIARRQVELGRRPGIDTAQTGIEAGRARQQQTLADSQVLAAQAALNTLMGRLPDARIAALSPIEYSPQEVRYEDSVLQALANRAEIDIELAEAEAFRQEARLARAEGRPDLVPQLRAERLFRSPRQLGVGIGISLPLLDYGGRRSRINQAEESAKAQADRAEARRAQVRRDVSQAIARLHAAQLVLENYQQGVLQQSRRLLDASSIGFQEGQKSIIELLEAQRTYRAVQTEYNNALADYAQARAQLERATGAVSANLLPVK